MAAFGGLYYTNTGVLIESKHSTLSESVVGCVYWHGLGTYEITYQEGWQKSCYNFAKVRK